MIDKATILYKGDLWAGAFYLLNSVLMGAISILLFVFTTKIGFFYLAIGMAVLSFFSLGKGCVMIFVYKSRFQFFIQLKSVSIEVLQDEKTYTEYRLLKKKLNRRRYLWTFVLVSLIAFFGVFTSYKPLLIGTCVPIVFMAALEFSVGLLTELRLWEYLRILDKSREELN